MSGDELGGEDLAVRSDSKIVKNLRLGISRGLSFLWLRWNSNSRFAIRNLNRSDAAASISWVRGLATAHRQECLCHWRRGSSWGAGAAADSVVCVVI